MKDTAFRRLRKWAEGDDGPYWTNPGADGRDDLRTLLSACEKAEVTAAYVHAGLATLSLAAEDALEKKALDNLASVLREALAALRDAGVKP